MKYASVYVEKVNFAADKPYSYIIPEDMEGRASAGSRVMVPFGSGNKQRIGIITSVSDECPGKRLKKIASVVDDSPILNDEMLSLALFIGERTFCPVYDAVKAMVPSGLNHKVVYTYCAIPCETSVFEQLSEKEKEIYNCFRSRGGYITVRSAFNSLKMNEDNAAVSRLVNSGLLITNVDAVRNVGDMTVRNVRLCESVPDGVRITKKQQEIIDVLNDVGCASVKEICYFTGLTPAVVAALVKNGVCEYYTTEVYRHAFESVEKPVRDEIELSPSQKKAYDEMLSRYSSGKSVTSLLYGVTGSGKTSVYISLIDKAVDDGRGVIVMVPEISLTPQTVSAFKKRYGNKIAVFHSALSVGERTDEWKRVARGEADICIGTRSAVFAPLKDIGLIIIDEEQEHTYKSEQSPRYSACEVAKFRSGYHKCLLMLASATPSVESFALAKSGKYPMSCLEERFGNAILPQVVTVDMRTEETVAGCPTLSRYLFDEITDALSKKRQIILLVNRRGFNTFVSCSSCGEVVTCPNCSISLTYHSRNKRLMCHYCGYSIPYSTSCPNCGEEAVNYSGFGTQRIEDELQSLLPDARIARMDTDTMTTKNSHEKLLDSFSRGEFDILIGTQMVAKGLDFPNVTLVGVISVDQQLHNDDFRSLERTFSLVTQVVGRSGRGDAAGKAVIQTLTPENEIIRLAAKQDYKSFFDTEIALRKAMTYPPYCDICRMEFSGEEEMKVSSASRIAMELLREMTSGKYRDEKIIVLGPMPARVAKVSNKYRFRILVKCKNSPSFRSMVSEILLSLNEDKRLSRVTVVADMNPESAM